MCEQLRQMPKATIAVIEGRVGGGGSELALSCDMRFAGPTAVFNQPEVALGIIPGGSGTVRLPRLIGRSRALEAILGCDDIDAATAERWGWVNRVLPTDELATFVDRLAARIASFPPHAVAAAKASVVRAEPGVVEQLLAEAQAFNGTLADPPTQSAMERFLELGGQTAGRRAPPRRAGRRARRDADLTRTVTVRPDAGRAQTGSRARRIAAAWAGKPSWSARATIDGAIRASAAASARATAVRLRNASTVMPDDTSAKPDVGSDAGQPITKLAALNGVCWPTRISPALTRPSTTASTSSSATATWRCSGA